MRYSLLESGKIISAIAPIDATGAGHDGDLVSMVNVDRLLICIQCGTWAGGTSAVTVTQETSASGTANTAVAFTKKWEQTLATDDILAEVAVTSNTFDLDTANELHIIEILPEMITSGNTHVRVRLATPGANADLVCAWYILTGIHYQDAAPITAIA